MELNLKQQEERKRERCWNKAERWKTIQETITWAEAQATVHRNTPAACLAKERRIRKQMGNLD